MYRLGDHPFGCAKAGREFITMRNAARAGQDPRMSSVWVGLPTGSGGKPLLRGGYASALLDPPDMDSHAG
jgi:hypothetical protein